jgi:mitochondrial enoyl-[acyl-carrier protein] reductase / trans-2-enoyl-CoA reductase
MFSFALLSRQTCIRLFSSTVRCLDRAIVYSEIGNPVKVLRVLTYPSLAPPPPNSVNIRFLLSPINPADINVVEGVYPSKPAKTDTLSHEGQSFVVGGNEGLAQVTAVGAGVDSLRVDDQVIMVKQQAGTWVTDRNVAVHDVVKVPDADALSESQAATMTVRPIHYYILQFSSNHLRSIRLLLTTYFLSLLTFFQEILLSRMVQIVLSVYQL